jgi:hypothetical protein
MSDERAKIDPKDHDVVLVHGIAEDGEGLRALRSRPGRLEHSVLRPVKAGRPIFPGGDLVRLLPREESPLLWNVAPVPLDGGATEVQEAAEAGGEGRARGPGHEGPAHVSSDAFRRGWEAIFGEHLDDDGSDRGGSAPLN